LRASRSCAPGDHGWFALTLELLAIGGISSAETFSKTFWKFSGDEPPHARQSGRA
jgi:hypothetical protein